MGSGSNTGSVPQLGSKRSTVGMLLALAIAAMLIVPVATFAGKGGGTSTPAWISLATDSGARAAQPSLGAAVRFSSGYASTTKNPWVSVTCTQDGALVYAQGGAPSGDFVLGGSSSTWISVGGAASCRAELGDLYWRGGKQYYTYLAHTTFDAAG
jgi:hypothetical protein